MHACAAAHVCASNIALQRTSTDGIEPISASNALLTTSRASASAGMLLRPPGSSCDTWQNNMPNAATAQVSKHAR
jgi:hypothetical protein